jgi:prophage tail gpP-like protein
MAIDLSETPGSLERPIDTRIELNVGGRAFKAWKSININRSLTQIAGSFSFTTANRFAGENEKWGITSGSPCTISIKGENIITGYVDEIEDGYGLGNHDITFSGRDKTGDLVDCSLDLGVKVIGSSGSFPVVSSEFKNLNVIQIVERLCAPFNISVKIHKSILAELKAARIADYRPELGSKVYEEIAFLGQQYAFLPMAFGDGNLTLTRVGTETALDTLEVGVNILANKLMQSDKERYSVYYAKGKVPTPNDHNKKLNVEGKYEDAYMSKGRFRPLVILIDEQANSDGVCKKRAQWEADIRAGASRKVETMVRGWDQFNGGLWPLNGIVQVKDLKIGVQDPFLIAGINLTLDGNGGELTRMGLVHPDTFLLQKRAKVPNTTRTVFDELVAARAAAQQ